MEIQWQEPPAPIVEKANLGSGRYIEFALTLKEHENQWAVLPILDDSPRTEKGAAAAAQNIKRGITKGFVKGDFEALHGPDEDGAYQVWVRYAPPVKVDRPEGGDAGEGEEPEASAGRDPNHGAAIRAWAREHGYEVRDRGALPERVIEAYHQAMDAIETGQGEADQAGQAGGAKLASVPR